MKQHISIIVIALALSASSVMAAESGAYGGIGIGLAPITDSRGSSGISSNRLGFGFENLSVGLVGGYNLNRYLGVEASINEFGLFGWSDALNRSVSAVPVSVEVVGYVPLFKGFDFFGKWGSSFTRLDFASSTAHAGMTEKGKTRMYGVGVEFSAGEKKSCRIGMDRYDLSVTPGTSVSTNYANITGVVRF